VKLLAKLFRGAGPRPATPDLTEAGATGTPILSGFLRDLGEYNTSFSSGPFSSYAIIEEMRRSDAQVAATLLACKLPIRSAEWTIADPKDATPIEQEAAEFIRSCLFEELDFQAILKNALLMLDFGCAAHEDIWYVDGNRVRLHALAPRLPHTFYRWITQPGTDELEALEQQGYRAEQYLTATIDADKLALFTFDREGANFAGRSLCRAMYKPWRIKSGLEKIDAISLERNGMGIPWAIGPENAKKEDRETAIAWLEKIATHEKSAIYLPFGWTWGIKGVEGQIRDATSSIAFQNMQITIAALAQFMMLGQTESGNRALGDTMSDFFYMGLQATAKEIARTLNLTTIRRLVKFNFGEEIRPPQLTPQMIAVGFDAIVAALKDLASSGVNAIQPDDELETWLRKKMGAPDPGNPRTRPQPPPPPPVAQVVPVGQAVPPATLSASAAPALRRAPNAREKSLALADIISALDKGRDDVAAALRRARSPLQAEIVHKLVSAPLPTMHRISIAPDARLVSEIEQSLSTIFDFGAAQIPAERDRQRAGAPPSDAAQTRLAAAATKRDPLGIYADAVVGEYINNLTARAANVALDWRRRPGALSPGEIIRKIEDDLDHQSDKWIDGIASKPVNESFADGRNDGYEQHKDEIAEVQYSALLDINTCENCSHADEATGPTPDDIPDVPNPDCDGADKCRCVHVYIFSDEVRNP